MRLGVLDVGSNTVHLLIVDAHRGGHPTPMASEKTALRLAESLDSTGRLSRAGADALVRAVADVRASATSAGCRDLLAFATSALRDAPNSVAVLARVHAETGVALQVLPGDDEARFTFLAVRRWFGWSAGRLLVLDIGGGSLELATGMDELPSVAESLPLGAGRLTREWLQPERSAGGTRIGSERSVSGTRIGSERSASGTRIGSERSASGTRIGSDPPSLKDIEALRAHVEVVLAPAAARLVAQGIPDRVVGTSKTFRTLARLAGAAPSSAGPRARRVLTDTGLHQIGAFISRMSAADLADLEGVSPNRAHQLVAGAVVAEAAMRALGAARLEICPWALREGVILRRLDWLDSATRGDRLPQGGAATGLTTGQEARYTG